MSPAARCGMASLPSGRGGRWWNGLTFIDNAERLHPEALLGLCTNLRTVTGAFILVVHNWEKFVEVAGRNHDVAWVVGRLSQSTWLALWAERRYTGC